MMSSVLVLFKDSVILQKYQSPSYQSLSYNLAHMSSLYLTSIWLPHQKQTLVVLGLSVAVKTFFRLV